MNFDRVQQAEFRIEFRIHSAQNRENRANAGLKCESFRLVAFCEFRYF